MRRAIIFLAALSLSGMVHAGFVTGVVVGSALSSDSGGTNHPQSVTVMPTSPGAVVISCARSRNGLCRAHRVNYMAIKYPHNLKPGMFRNSLERQVWRMIDDRRAEFTQPCSSKFPYADRIYVDAVTEITQTHWSGRCVIVRSTIPAEEYARDAGYRTILKQGVVFHNGDQHIVMEVVK